MLFRNNSEKYGKFEDGNQMSFVEFEEYVRENYKSDFKLQQLLVQMKDIVKLTFLSVQHKLEVRFN